MGKENLYQPFEIECKELQRFPASMKRINFFELIYVMEGAGTQVVNNNRFTYRKGNLFLLTPQDAYSFDISVPTTFFFLRFNELVNTIITVVARNIALKLPKNIKENTGEAVLEILHYIQENIFDPKMLRAEMLSKQFSISLSYLGRYFKKQTGETLQHYIANYKLRLVEARLLHSDMTINEIAYEFDFTDESHLNRAFKKHKGMSPTAYRKLNQAAQ
ncbi:AraC family transcriptional regulator [uncultured Chitinophaga sp.]|jgi:AraC-type DNA-binding domain-containing proteins|uniref:AraC family transcriptional regulator n=1 Tax=uncultured Chitinophaga sp. TaxID=339340 RepID=UPI00261F4383|nr:AraC family transcriptional regulator [uncultured Chitinophaga sp.]